MAWVEDWDNFGPLYTILPFLEELRFGLLERELTVDPDGAGDILHTPIANLKTLEPDFFSQFQSRMSVYLSDVWLQTWTEGTWATLPTQDLPIITEATMLTQIGAGSRIAAPAGLHDLTPAWMLQQYDMINELIYYSEDIRYKSFARFSRLGIAQNVVFATADSQADTAYAGASDTGPGGGNAGMLQTVVSDLDKVGPGIYRVAYNSAYDGLFFTSYDGYKSDVDYYFPSRSPGTSDGFHTYTYSDFGLGLTEDGLGLGVQHFAQGGTGGFGVDTTETTQFPANNDFTGRFPTDVPLALPDEHLGWKASPTIPIRRTIASKFNVTGGFTKVV